MKFKALYLLLVLLLVGSVISCGKPTPAAARLTDQQVISIVQVYGVPNIHQYTRHLPTGAANPAGQWAAVYEGDAGWKVQGAIVITAVDGRPSYYSTTWRYSDEILALTEIQ